MFISGISKKLASEAIKGNEKHRRDKNIEYSKLNLSFLNIEK